MTMKQAQAKCRRWRTKGDARSLRAADRLEAKFRDHPDYESDMAYIMRAQSGDGSLLPNQSGYRRRRAALSTTKGAP